MKTFPQFYITFFLLGFLFNFATAQRNLSTPQNLPEPSNFYTVHFDEAPNKKKLKRKGIFIEAYLGNNEYIVRSKKKRSYKGHAFTQISPQQKIQSTLLPLLGASQELIEVIIDFHQKPKQLKTWIKSQKGSLVEEYYGQSAIVAKVPATTIASLAKARNIKFIAEKPSEVEPLNHEASVVLNARGIYIPDYGELTGKNIVVGIGDGGELGQHLDFEGRVNNKAAGTYTSYGSHGDLVAGNIGGGGHLNTAHKGIAPEANLLIQKTTRIITKAPSYIEEGMVLTNNSYGSATNCTTTGLYDYSSKMIDEQMVAYPNLLHVFAVGNSGEMVCDGHDDGFQTILKSYAPSKNSLCVGAVNLDKQHLAFSGKGPTADGRIKPEICGVSEDITSTGRTYNYGSFGGSSAATAFVTGSLALMYEAYQSKYNSLPQNSLIKAIACNTADDQGNEGPDYSYGFGVVNVKRAVQVINKAQFVVNQVQKDQQRSHIIQVPSGLVEAKFLLNWTDLAAEAYPNVALVNDLDLSLTDPNGNEILPWVLSKNQPNEKATRGKDQLNNIEQISIKNPISGEYTLRVKGSAFPISGIESQAYALTYDFIENALTLDYPNGGEKWLPNTTQIIAWTSNGASSGTFNVEYKSGSTWKTIQEGIPFDKRCIAWNIPTSLNGSNIQIRVSNTANGRTDDSNREILVLDAPQIQTQALCDNLVKINWNAVADATSYEVVLFKNSGMVSIDQVDGLEYYIDEKLQSGQEYWIAVKAVKNGLKGNYKQAVKIKPESIADCDWANDISLEEILIDYKKGRAKTSKALDKNTEIAVWIHNRGNNAVKNFDLVCYLNNKESLREKCTTTIPSGESYLYHFKNKPDLSLAGTYQLKIEALLNGDRTPKGNIAGELELIQIDNASLALPLISKFRDAETMTYEESTLGLNGLEFVDFEPISSCNMNIEKIGNGETSINFIAPGGMNTSKPKGNLVMTFNLPQQNYRGLRLDIDYKFKAGKASSAPNQRIWVRGNDTQEWLLLTELTYSSNWRSLEALDINSILRDGQQNTSSSFQIKFECNQALWSIKKTSLYVDFNGNSGNPKTGIKGTKKNGGRNG